MTNATQINNSEKNNCIPLVNKLFMIVFAFQPIFEYYQSPISSLNLATFLLFPLLLFLVVFQRKIRLPKFIFLVYLFFITVNLLITNTFATAWLSFFRTLLWFITAFFFAANNFKHEYFFLVLKRLLVVSAVMICFQVVMKYIFHTQIRFVIPSLLRGESYINVSSTSFRASGMYLEPAHYAQSAIFYLAYELFGVSNKVKTKFEWLTIASIAMGIVLSGSGQGYLYLVMLFGMWGVRYFMASRAKNKARILLIFIALAICLCTILFTTSVGKYALSRIMASDQYGFGGVALAGRVYGIEVLENLSPIQRWLGVGAYSAGEYTSAYLTSYISVNLTLGWVGLGYFVCLCWYVLRKAPTYGKYFVIIYMAMFFVASMTNIASIVFYFMPMLYTKDREGSGNT